MQNADDVRRSVYAVARRAQTVEGLFRSSVEVLRRSVSFNRWCGLTIDPHTLLPTGGVHDEGLPQDHLLRLLELEHGTPDLHLIPELAQAPSPVGVLSSRDRTASRRYVELLEPNGVSDELRVALRSGDRTWGGLILFRSGGSFESPDAELVRDIAVYLSAAIRRLLVTAEHEAAEAETGPGVLLLDGSSLRGATPAGRRLLEELDEVGTAGDDRLPPSVVAIANAARRTSPGPARVRTRSRTGRWLSLHAAPIGDPASDGALADAPVAVTIELADPAEIAPLILSAYGLSGRQQEVALLVMQGLATRQIASRLFVSEHTVTDHLKTIFDKIGVRSRRELVSAMFFRHYLPGGA